MLFRQLYCLITLFKAVTRIKDGWIAFRSDVSRWLEGEWVGVGGGEF